MKFRTTLVLLALAAGALAFLILYTLRRPGQAEYEEGRDLVFAPAEVGPRLSKEAVGLNLLWRDKVIALSRPSTAGQDWRMTQPIAALADPETISSILAALESLKSLRTLGRNAGTETFKEYGLAPPEGRILFTLADGRSFALGIGAMTADGNSVYAMRPEDSLPEVLILPRVVRDVAQMEAGDVREKRLLRFDPAKADRLTLASAEGTSIELRNGFKGWEIVQPVSDLAEPGNVLGLLRNLSGRALNRESFADLPPEACGLDKPSLTVAIFEGEKSATLRLGSPTPDGKGTYASRDGDHGVILLDATLAKALHIDLNELRARRALPFPPEEVTAVTVAGPVPIKLERKNAAWQLVSSGKGADPERMRFFLRRLSELEVKERADNPAAGELAREGLEPPRQTVSVETPRTAWELRFGAEVPGSTLVYARRGISGPILTVPDMIMEMLTAGEAAFAERIVALDLRKESITSIRIAAQGKTVLLVRDGKNWSLKEPAGTLNKDAVASLLLDISLVEAIEALPVPERLSDYGLDKPQTTVTVSVEGPPAGERRLLIGNRLPGGEVYAMNQDGERVFVLDEGILKSLQQEFVEK